MAGPYRQKQQHNKTQKICFSPQDLKQYTSMSKTNLISSFDCHVCCQCIAGADKQPEQERSRFLISQQSYEEIASIYSSRIHISQN